MDIRIPIEIHGVPDEAVAVDICATIREALLSQHGTDMWIVHEVLED